MNQIRVWGAAAITAAALTVPSFAADPMTPPTAGIATFELFSESEAAAWNTPKTAEPTDFNTRDLGDDNDTPNCHSTSDNDADNPKIRILTPALGRALVAPLDIDLQFVPTSNSAPIRPETFRVCYMGFVTMDITKRITDHVTVSEHGLHVSGVQLPHGHHHLLLLIADQRGRLGRYDAVLDIVQ